MKQFDSIFKFLFFNTVIETPICQLIKNHG
jgi:hypothetical protein